MNDDQLDDLKQFIAAVVSQTEVRLGDRIDGHDQKFINIEQKLTNLERKIDDGFAGVGEALDEIHNQLEVKDAHDKAVDQRLTKLERAA